MDNQYLKNLGGSPYVDEGLYDRFKASGAGMHQQFKGMTGRGWESPEDVKIKSILNSCLEKIKKLTKTFISDYENIKRYKPNDINIYKKDLNRFVKLGDSLGVKLPLHQNFYNYGKADRNYAEKGSESMFHPKRIKTSTEEGIEIVRSLMEANYNIFPLTQARSSNNTKILIDAYKGELRKIYDGLVFDFKKIASDKEKIKNIVKRLNTTIFNSLKISELILNTGSDSIFWTMSKKSASTPGDAPIPAAGSPASTAATPTSTPPVITPVNSTNSTSTNANSELMPDGLTAEVLKKSAMLITQKIFESGSSTMKQHQNNPVSYFKVGTNSSNEDIPITDINEEIDDEIDDGSNDRDEGDDKSGFTYKFRGFFRKNTGNFNIVVGAFKDNNVTYEVRWHNHGSHGGLNDIWLGIRNKDNPIDIKIFRFFDHDISPNLKSSENFSIKQLFEDANPKLAHFITPEDEIIFKEVEENFHRALYAIVAYKSREFKTPQFNLAKTAIKQLIEELWTVDDASSLVGKVMSDLAGKLADVNDVNGGKVYGHTKIEEFSTQEIVVLTKNGNPEKTAINVIKKNAYDKLINLQYKSKDILSALEKITITSDSGEMAVCSAVEKIIKQTSPETSPEPPPPPPSPSSSPPSSSPPSSSPPSSPPSSSPPSSPPSSPETSAAPIKSKASELDKCNAWLKKHINNTYVLNANEFSKFKEYIDNLNELIIDQTKKPNTSDEAKNLKTISFNTQPSKNFLNLIINGYNEAKNISEQFINPFVASNFIN